MAKKIQRYDSFKRGDTPVFMTIFTAPSVGFSWAGITADMALTAVAAPNDNTGAGVLRLNVVPTIDVSNQATVTLQPTVAESKALVPGTTYKYEVQLKEAGGTNVATAITGEVVVDQDYVI